MSNKLMAGTLIEHLIRHDEAVAGLYRLCASRFMDAADFWNSLADHKEWRADALHHLKRAVMAGEMEFASSLLSIRAVATSLEYVESMRRAVTTRRMTFGDALEIAWTVEGKTAGKYAFEAFNWDAPEAVGMLETITARIEEHLNLIAQRRDQAKAKSPEGWHARLLGFLGVGKIAKSSRPAKHDRIAQTDTLESLRTVVTW